MTWVKFPNTWAEQDEIEGLGSDAAMLYISAVSYSGRHLTDGHVPTRALRRLWAVEDIEAAIEALIEAGLWEETERGYHLPQWRMHLLAASEIEEKRRKSAESSERYRRHQAGDHSMCDRCSHVRSDSSPDRSRDASVTPLGSGRVGSGRRPESRDETESRNVRATTGAHASLPVAAGGTPWQHGVTPTVTVYDDREQNQ